ncbi:Protein mlo2 [Cytospora mali]|uniref:Protein mlo2 n=1 Tax=Cytospora mali TaxID=578113 RepID=A0A194UV31_CYTMA|nr:Protein mlo2 [Valsa mali var. pyri (nom. inval.)]
MDPPPAPVAETNDANQVAPTTSTRRESTSQQSDGSQTAAEIIRDQMQLEADAREALPYSIENCTKDLGALRQSVFACLTCNPPANSTDAYNAAGICYACSVQCHGEHQLVEIFAKRNFTCDCGTTRLPATSPCSLRLNPTTSTKGGVHSEEPAPDNKYNQNFRNRFCVCECDYDPFQQKGTMYQCLGLGTHETGGCGEDWYHPGCVMGLGSKWYEKTEGKKVQKNVISEADGLPAISEEAEATVQDGGDEDEETPNPPGFPLDDDFETFICFKCVEANPWIKRYAGTPGFLLPVHLRSEGDGEPQFPVETAVSDKNSRKRKADDEDLEDSQESKKLKSEADTANGSTVETNTEGIVTDVKEEPKPAAETNTCKYDALPPAPQGTFSLFCSELFRERFCRCAKCFPNLAPHAQLLEEEETYEPPISEGGSENGQSTNGSGSLYERGESALRNVDRVRAIEGVMAYNQLKDKLKPFFQQFAESGKAISAEDIKEYFAKLRGDEEAIKEAGESAKSDNRQEQPGF